MAISQTNNVTYPPTLNDYCSIFVAVNKPVYSAGSS